MPFSEYLKDPGLSDRQKLAIMKLHFGPRSMWFLAGLLGIVILWLFQKFEEAEPDMKPIWPVMIFIVGITLILVVVHAFQRIMTIRHLEKKVASLPYDPEHEKKFEEEFKRQVKGPPGVVVFLFFSLMIYVWLGMYLEFAPRWRAWPLWYQLLGGIIIVSIEEVVRAEVRRRRNKK